MVYLGKDCVVEDFYIKVLEGVNVVMVNVIGVVEN